jgi:C4-dicarboxylate transporter DctQ subunit
MNANTPHTQGGELMDGHYLGNGYEADDRLSLRMDMQVLHKISRRLESHTELISGFFLILILAFVFLEVVSRYIFAASHGFMEEFSRWFQIWLAYLMLGVVEKRRRHIAIDILPGMLTGKTRDLLMIAISILNLIVAVVLCYAGIMLTQLLKQTGVLSQTAIPTPMWIVRLCIPLGAIFLAFFSIEHIVSDIRNLISQNRRSKE